MVAPLCILEKQYPDLTETHSAGTAESHCHRTRFGGISMQPWFPLPAARKTNRRLSSLKDNAVESKQGFAVQSIKRQVAENLQVAVDRDAREDVGKESRRIGDYHYQRRDEVR
jgi:hypothetical protein